ncbi:hypothetical protein EV361DRAFT_918184 [Lentinula raphanica]|uniref:Uncharacterized protein n=1 Tax=Lentinula raphanica TaxID=153919 RepID=A0AA38P4W1_9AGAR|nr:hypothetical protein F5878DRAFT_625327 [Lentinula raphanica]KAJ3969983.1 hypothetical protein EV361DRAFT_918184 [Lentinula raphanica]
MATHTRAQILSSASYHTSLLQTIESLQYAPSALKQQSKYLSDLEVELVKVKQEVKQLGAKTKKERKEHEELRDSTTRRLTARLKGKAGIEKYEAKKEKEEREYVEALENEMRERGKQTMLENMIKQARTVKLDLEEKSKRLDATKHQLSNLYHQVFDGLTVDFPRDDVLERQLASAQETYDRIQYSLNSHSQAVNLLTQADKMMDMSLKKIGEALSYSTWDIYGGGRFADAMERDALSNAAVYAANAEMLFRQAQSTSKDVQAIGPIRVHDISILGDIFFDNIFSDVRVHRQIENNRNELADAAKRLKAQVRAARRRAQQAGADLVEASEVLAECNRELESYRRDVFLRIAGGENVNSQESGTDGSDLPAPPPQYGETRNTTHVYPDTLIAHSDNPRLLDSSSNPSPNATTSVPPPRFSRYAPPSDPPPFESLSQRLASSRIAQSPSSESPRTPVSEFGRSQSMRMPEPSFPSTTASLTSSVSLAVPSPGNPQRRSPRENVSGSSPSHRRSHSSASVSTAPSSNLDALRTLRRSRSSVSDSTPSLNPISDEALVSASNAPDPESGSRTGPAIELSPPPPGSNESEAIASSGERENAGSSSHAPSRSPSPEVHVPNHWGSKNPFAAMMMG